ncbi:MAG TPA: GNAT family N-acetyltransferase [Bryobacteraceae bacterium]|jgi:CelD/BcsL family acetyltransferase involved in cellulose biosynthesis|nr:GNAT family N-acetyltransferase [Bryobacteraceae bacterium]
MRLEVIDSLGRLEEFRHEWRSFVETVDRLTPFQLPAWLLTWWRHFGSGRLQVLVLSEKGSTVGVVPLFRHKWQGRAQLTLVGSGISDYLDPAIAPGREEEVILKLRGHLLNDCDWDICDWQDLAADSPLAALARVQGDTPCSEIRLNGGFEEYWARRSKDLRRNLRRYRSRAEQDGPLEFAVTCGTGLMNELIRLHGDRWERQGQPGMVAANSSAEFLRDVAREFERLQSLRFFSLRFKGEIVALSVGFLYRNTIYSYLSAFDPQYEILGFGRTLLYESLRHAYGQHYIAWNFCRGDEPYKFSFGAQAIAKSRLILTRGRGDITGDIS